MILDILRETQALTWRWILHGIRQPIVIVAGLFEPLIWFYLFGAAFSQSGRAVTGGGASYTEFLAAGIIVFTAFRAALASGVSVLFDRETEFLDRLLVAPLASRASIIVSSAAYIGLQSILQSLVVIVAVGFADGTRSIGTGDAALIALTVVLFVIGITAVSIALAFLLRAHFEMLSLIQVVALPLVFASTALVPLAVMPRWLQWVALFNPMTYAIEAVRVAMMGGDFWAHVLLTPVGALSAAGCAGVLAGLDLAMMLGAGAVVRWRMR